jgi:hypothetical protein
MKNYIRLFTLLLFSTRFVNAQELVVEITTDNNSEETYWTLFDTSDQSIATSSTLADLTTYRDTIQLSAGNCYYWTIYDSYGDGLSGGYTPGSFKLYLDGVLTASCENPNFGDSASVYSLGSDCASNDIKMMQIALFDYISKDTNLIAAEVLNMGSETITSIEAVYTINGTESAVQKIENLQIEVGSIQTLEFPDAYLFDSSGLYDISIAITKVNAYADAHSANNTLSKNVTVVDGFVQKNVIEDFASYACGYCYLADEAIQAATRDYSGTYGLVKYMCWGTYDTKYYDELEPLQDYYFVGGLPSVFINGSNVNYTYFTPTYYQDYLGLATPVKLTVDASLEGDSLVFKAKVYSNETISEAFNLRASVIENTSFDVSIGYENNTPYYNISYHLVNGFNGFEIEGLTAGETLEFTSKVSLTDFPLEDGSLNDMHVTVYLQNTNNKQIIQSAEYVLAYSELPLIIQSNILDGAIDIDTTGLVLTFDANRKLYNKNGAPISKIADHVVLRKNSETGASVPALISLNDDCNKIVIEPQYGWSANTSYYVKIADFTTLDGLAFGKAEYLFTTKNYVGVSSKLESKIEVYPNPANNTITLNLSDAMQISIFSANGILMDTKNFEDGKIQMDISELSSGYYFLQAIGSKSIRRVKFLKL